MIAGAAPVGGGWGARARAYVDVSTPGVEDYWRRRRGGLPPDRGLCATGSALDRGAACEAPPVDLHKLGGLDCYGQT